MATPEPVISWLQILIAFTAVFGLIALMGVGLKYINLKGLKLPRRQPSQPARLEIIESIPLDLRRRLVIVRQDGQEHLLLLGLNQDIVVSANLPRPSTSESRSTP